MRINLIKTKNDDEGDDDVHSYIGLFVNVLSFFQMLITVSLLVFVLL